MNEPARSGGSGAITRGLAARAVEGVLAQGRTLEDSLGALELHNLAVADRGQVKALAFGALRWHHRHRQLLAQLLVQGLPKHDRLLEALLSVGLFQVLDETAPDYAAVSATVEAARWLGRSRAVGLVNATLRRTQRERDSLMQQVMRSTEGRYSHPEWFVGQLQRDWPDEWPTVLEAAQRQPPLWLRVNVDRTNRDAFCDRLAAAGLAASPMAGVAQALRLSRPVPVKDIPGFSEGEASVQDAASQLAAVLLDPPAHARVLDACAAPGGKATHLLERAGGRLDLTALDVDATRMDRVRENLERLALPAATVVGDASRPADWWDGKAYDDILVDAPCSGTGVIRRHPDIKWLRRAGDIAPFARRQRALLDALWPLLRRGGRLLYATCSVLAEENVAVVRQFLVGHPDAALVEPAPGVVPAWAAPQPGGGWQILPGRADTDGLYYALMTRT
jgi:16S rRNA (cytosine967-C5)-methyltransferase